MVMKKFIFVLFVFIISASYFTVPAYADSWKKTDNGYVYIYDDGKTAEQGWLKVDGKTYYIQKDGTRKTGWLKVKSGAKYYFDKNGEMVKSKIVKFTNGKKYYFLSNGKMAVNYTYKNGKTFNYFNSDGELQYTATIKLGMDLKSLYNAVDKTYYYENNTDGTDIIYKLNSYSGNEYMELYYFYGEKLLFYGYAFEKSSVKIKNISDYFSDKYDAKPNKTNNSTGECYWKFKSYYLSVFTLDDVNLAIYAESSLIDIPSETSSAKNSYISSSKSSSKSSSSKTSSSSSSSKSSTFINKNSSSYSNNYSTSDSKSRTVYITPTGSKYHYDGHCNGGTYTPSTLDAAKRLGLTPCKKCAQ